MSDEERDGEKWIRHRPSYRSDMFNHFIDKLDSRAQDLNRAQFPRNIGSPRIKSIPPTASKWMLCENCAEEEEDVESPVLFSSSASSAPDDDSDNN